MRISYDPHADAAYIHLSPPIAGAHRATTQAATPDGVEGWIALDWQDRRIVGIEILDATSRLSQEVLDQADAIN